MIARIGAILLAWLCAAPLSAQEDIVLGLSQDSISITTDFSGSELLIFGAIKRETPIPPENLDVVITVAGPLAPLVVRRKERRYGIWINTESEVIDAAPSFYAVASSAPLGEVISAKDDRRERISIPRAVRAYTARLLNPRGKDFADAVIRIRTDEGAFKQLDNTVEVAQDTLFNTSISLPANLTDGTYQVRIFLARSGNIIASHDSDIAVRKVGLEQFLFNLSRRQPLVYGLLSLALAVLAGWGASALFRLIRER